MRLPPPARNGKIDDEFSALFLIIKICGSATVILVSSGNLAPGLAQRGAKRSRALGYPRRLSSILFADSGGLLRF